MEPRPDRPRSFEHYASSPFQPYQHPRHPYHPAPHAYHPAVPAHISSFESSTSSAGGRPEYPYYPPPPYYWMPPPMMPHIEYIRDVQPNDVLSGRGGATNSHSGNRAFRSLVKDYQPKYLAAKKADKPSVASQVVEEIRRRGGRFLRRCEGLDASGQVYWLDIGDERAREKTCQALREGAPELRRKQNKRSLSEDEESDQPPLIQATFSSASSVQSWMGCGNDDHENLDALTIEPMERLLGGRSGGALEPIPLEQLSPTDRDLYLRDFFPPCPTVDKKPPRLSASFESELSSPRAVDNHY